MDSKPGEVKRLTARIIGRVQGVGFRQSAVREARRLGLTGWVRNHEDGSVELVAEGPEEKLQQLRHQLARGPSASKVESVEADLGAATGEFPGFSVVY